MKSKLTQQLEELLSVWRKSAPDHYEVCSVIECLAYEIDAMDTLGHVSKKRTRKIGKNGFEVPVIVDVSINAIALESLNDLCEEFERVTPVEQDQDAPCAEFMPSVFSRNELHSSGLEC